MKTPEERLALLEAAAKEFRRVSVPIKCADAWNGWIELSVNPGIGRFDYFRDINVSGGSRLIPRERALEYIARTVTDPLAD